MEGHAEAFQAEFVGEAKLAEAEEVFAEVFGEVAADELLGTVVEGADTICTCVFAKGGTLWENEVLVKKAKNKHCGDPTYE
jgi:hypothetical protein